MAQNAIDGVLIDQLITSITSTSKTSDPERFDKLKRNAEQKVLQHNYGRTNQFAVQKQLLGLDEKLRILDNEELAEALKVRLGELSGASTRWTPEILSLFLQLSDRPASRGDVDSLAAVKAPAPRAPLTWGAIVADDPLNETGIWENVDFAAESSDGDGGLEDGRGVWPTTEDTRLASLEDQQDLANAQACLLSSAAAHLDGLTDAQFWKHQVPHELDRGSGTGKGWLVTEQQAIRETLLMLSGLPTALYTLNKLDHVAFDERYCLRHVSPHTLKLLLDSYSTMGTQLNELRAWTKQKHDVAVRQSLSAAIDGCLQQFSTSLSKIQDRFIRTNAPMLRPVGSQRRLDPLSAPMLRPVGSQRRLDPLNAPVVVSLIAVHQEIQPQARPLLSLSKLLGGTERHSASDIEHFRELELLFDASCASQMTGDDLQFEFMAKLFFQGFRTYLKPIRQWMRLGEIQESLFICKTEAAAADRPEALWHAWYALRTTPSGALYAPRFLHPKIDRVLTTGKSVAFLRRLHRFQPPESDSSADELELDCTTPLSRTSLVPFSEVLGHAFDAWIATQHRTSSQTLRQTLVSDCGLSRALDALSHLYLHQDGALVCTIATTLFERLDEPGRRRQAWNDRLLLTALYHDTFSAVASIDAERLSLSLSLEPLSNSPAPPRSSLAMLSSVTVAYALPWPLLNIITPSSMQTYQRVSTLLLQLRRARYNLSRPHPRDGSRLKLAHRLRSFATTLLHHLTSTVLAPCTSRLRRRLAAAEDMDAMLAIHSSFVSDIERACLLSREVKPIHAAVLALLELACGAEADTNTPQAKLDEYSTLLGFVTAGLRGVARAAGGADGHAADGGLATAAADGGLATAAAAWERLAERLE